MATGGGAKCDQAALSSADQEVLSVPAVSRQPLLSSLGTLQAKRERLLQINHTHCVRSHTFAIQNICVVTAFPFLLLLKYSK